MVLENVYGLAPRFSVMEDASESAERQILNLIYAYSWLLDAGQFDAMGELFVDADLAFDGQVGVSKDAAAVAQSFKDFDKTYEDGTLNTMHMVIDPMIHVDEEAGKATADHYTVVVQGITGEFGPQIISMDKKFDEFTRGEDGIWRFSYRNMVGRAVGDLSHHAKYSYGGVDPE